MPHLQPLNALDRLRDRLRSELDVHQAVHAIEWGNPRVMKEALKLIQRDLGGSGNDRPAEDQLNLALQRFAKNQFAASFTELKYVCYGATVPVGEEQWRLIDRRQLFDVMLAQVQEQSAKPKQFRRCYQGLLSAYFGFERNLEETTEADTRWLSLRGYLSDQLDPLRDASLQRGLLPDWLITLSEHRNLLSSDPCSRYAAGLARDEPTELKQVCVGLGIPSNSWVWDEALMAYVRLVCQTEDAGFKQRMGAVLNLINGRTSLKLPAALATKATAMTVTRYSQCADHPEHHVLRDSCIEWIGNPWLKRTAWDAFVNHEPARLMVNSWLKQRLIKDFFQLLAADGAADLRRLNYWLKWEPQISDMWFVLGSSAQENRTEEFRELRRRMAGRDRLLQDPNHLNNAFVMRIGQLLVIEFGVTGNACFVFAASDFKTNLNRQTLKTNFELKQHGSLKRLSHQGNWESRFDYELRRLLQSVPESMGHLREFQSPLGPGGLLANAMQRITSGASAAVTESGNLQSQKTQAHKTDPALPDTSSVFMPKPPWPSIAPVYTGTANQTKTPTATARSTDRYGRPLSNREPSKVNAKSRLSAIEFEQLRRLFIRHGVDWEDNRMKGGALWVLIPIKDQKPFVTSVLDMYGFRFAENKGYWLKDEG